MAVLHGDRFEALNDFHKNGLVISERIKNRAKNLATHGHQNPCRG